VRYPITPGVGDPYRHALPPLFGTLPHSQSCAGCVEVNLLLLCVAVFCVCVCVCVCVHSLLAGVPVAYTGDPLRDLGLTAFLDKFVNKKPKVGCNRLCVATCLI
jgi:hypothetical protein